MRARTAILAALGIVASQSAQADQLDGDWCSSKSLRHLNIQGPIIVTPAGERVNGNYARHYFDYLAPTGELEAGKRVWLRQVNDETMLFLVDGEASPVVWNRCSKPIA